MSTWEQRMSEQAHRRGWTQRAIREHDLAVAIAEQKAEHPEWFDPTPPPGTCPMCIDWRLDNPEMGRYIGFLVCPAGWQNCDHDCHDDRPGERIALAMGGVTGGPR